MSNGATSDHNLRHRFRHHLRLLHREDLEVNTCYPTCVPPHLVPAKVVPMPVAHTLASTGLNYLPLILLGIGMISFGIALISWRHSK
jgi:hypothetical protein